MNSTSLKLLFTPTYIFNPEPGYYFTSAPFFLIFFSVLVLLAIVTAFLAYKKRKSVYRPLYAYLANWGLWVGLVGLLLVFFRLQGIPYFSMRALFAAWIIMAIVWIVLGLKAVLRTIARSIADQAQERRKNLYRKK